MEWQPPETAPKDKVFIGVFKSYPPMPTYYRAVGNDYVVALIQTGPIDGEWSDAWFETTDCELDQLTKWTEMPDD